MEAEFFAVDEPLVGERFPLGDGAVHIGIGSRMAAFKLWARGPSVIRCCSNAKIRAAPQPESQQLTLLRASINVVSEGSRPATLGRIFFVQNCLYIGE